MSEEGGRIFFSSTGRSVGVDIGSSTSHLVFSRLVLERLDNRYVVAERKVLHESDVLLTPYSADATIDPVALGAFIEEQYRLAKVDPRAIDTGELIAAQAGKFVSLSAGDALEATLAAHGSGACARSIRESARVMNVDIGGGTSKIAVCDAGEIAELTALDVGARIVAFDAEGRVNRIEEAARRFSTEADFPLQIGRKADAGGLNRMVERMADRLFKAMSRPTLDAETRALVRLEPLRNERKPEVVTFSGGVAEYLYGRETRGFGDLGEPLARAILERVRAWGPRIELSDEGIRATVIGASQYTVQVSGSTIFVAPQSVLPLRNVPVVRPALPLEEETLAADRIAGSVRAALRRLDLDGGERPVALCYRWKGSATFVRLDAFCRGIAAGLAQGLARGQPL